jgi:hypothetical protein
MEKMVVEIYYKNAVMLSILDGIGEGELRKSTTDRRKK